MVNEDDGPLESRPPTLNDLVALCQRLNGEGARYIVIGGMAVIQVGFVCTFLARLLGKQA